MGAIFILKRIGFFIVDHWRIFIAAGAIMLAAMLLWRAFRPAPPKIDEQAIQEAVIAIEQKNDAKLQEILVRSDLKERQIDDSLANSKAATVNAIAESRQRYANMNTADLAAEIERRK